MVTDDQLQENPWGNHTDEEIAMLAQNNNGDAQLYLLNKYKRLVLLKTRGYFLAGADDEDLIQEGMIGLYKAIRDFKIDRQSYFFSFAELCIKRQLITAIKASTRQKHIPLNTYISLNSSISGNESEKPLQDIIGDRNINPEDLYISREETNNILNHLQNNLTDFERDVLDAFLGGNSYRDIARKLNRSTKAVDNALQRIKKKTSLYLSEQK